MVCCQTDLDRLMASNGYDCIRSQIGNLLSVLPVSDAVVPLSQTQFEGRGIGYRFTVDDKGVATDLVETHNSGESRLPRQK
jgi:hypothetical protein